MFITKVIGLDCYSHECVSAPGMRLFLLLIFGWYHAISQWALMTQWPTTPRVIMKNMLWDPPYFQSIIHHHLNQEKCSALALI